MAPTCGCNTWLLLHCISNSHLRRLHQCSYTKYLWLSLQYIICAVAFSFSFLENDLHKKSLFLLLLLGSESLSGLKLEMITRLRQVRVIDEDHKGLVDCPTFVICFTVFLLLNNKCKRHNWKHWSWFLVFVFVWTFFDLMFWPKFWGHWKGQK